MIREIHELQLYFGEDYVINDKLRIHQPTIGDIVSIGEKNYYSTVYSIAAIPSDMKAQLDDMGVDYEAITDFELFVMQCKSFSQEITEMFFGDIDFSKFSLHKNKENDELFLYCKDSDIKIDRYIYQVIVEYIRYMHHINPKIERAGNAYTKKILIDESRQKIALAKDKSYKSTLVPLVSSMVNSAGFKYNLQEVKNMKLCAFMDSVQRIQTIKSAETLLMGCYCGNIDMSKISKKELNWLRELKEDKTP